MTLVAKIDGVTLPDGAVLIGGSPNSALPGGIQGLPTAASYGEAPTGGLVLDDPNGDLDGVVTLEGLHTFTIDETACTGKTRIWSGWLTGRAIHRGPYKDGPARVWEVDIIDMNLLFALMVFRASSAKRPEESDIVRVEWARNSAPMSNTPIQDNGRWNVTDNPVNFGPSDYVTKFPIELFATVAGISGKNVYAYWDHTAGEISGHYDLRGVGPTSTLAISNDMADTDSTTFYPFIDARLERNSGWKVTGMLLGFLGGQYAYGVRQATIDTMDPSEFSVNGFQRDEVYTTDRIGKLATATANIQTMLEERAVDRDVVTCAIRVPASQVNLVEAGDLIDAKFTHIPGYEAGGLVPVIRRNVIPTPGRTDMYDIHLELSTSARPTAPGGGDPGEGPYDPGTGEVSVFHAYGRNRSGSGGIAHQRWDSVFTASAGNIGLLGISVRNGATLSDVPQSVGGGAANWTQLPNGFSGGGGFTDSVCWYWTEFDGGEVGFTDYPFGSAGGAWAVYELVGADSATFATALVSSSGTVTGAPIAGPAGDPAFVAMIVAASGDSHVSYTPEAGWTELVDTQPSGDFHPHFTSIYKVTDSAEATETPETTLGSSRSWHALSVIVEASAGDSNPLPPGAGMQVRNEEVTMVGADGETRFPFMAGSLEVFVDNTDQTAAIIAQDPEAGTFTLGFTPTPTELVIVNYQAAVGGPGT